MVNISFKLPKEIHKKIKNIANNVNKPFETVLLYAIENGLLYWQTSSEEMFAEMLSTLDSWHEKNVAKMHEESEKWRQEHGFGDRSSYYRRKFGEK